MAACCDPHVFLDAVQAALQQVKDATNVGGSADYDLNVLQIKLDSILQSLTWAEPSLGYPDLVFLLLWAGKNEKSGYPRLGRASVCAICPLCPPDICSI